MTNDAKVTAAPVEFGSTNSPEVVETSGAAEPETFEEAVAEVGEGSMLGYRLTQQAILSDFGLRALQESSLDALLHDAARCAAKGMRTSLAKILEYRPGSADLLIRAGVGWRSGVVGVATIGADNASPAGFAYQSGAPVISNHLDKEDRFRTPEVMSNHGVRRAINVLIARLEGPWGVLEVDSSNAGEFEAADLAFLQGLANFVGVASDRIAIEQQLREALEFQQMLVKEASHRVKNSLAMLSGLMKMQARSVTTDEAAAALGDASERIMAVATTHDQLWRQDQSEAVDLAVLLPQLCHQLNAQSETISVHCKIASFEVSANKAMSMALLVTEAVTNAFKHAFDAGAAGEVRIEVMREHDTARLTVTDNGRGLPEAIKGGDPKSASLGMRLIRTLGASIGSGVEMSGTKGTQLIVSGIERSEFDGHAGKASP